MLIDRHSHLWWTGISRPVVHGHDENLCLRPGSGEGLGKVIREGGNPALAWRMGPEEGNAAGERHHQPR